MKLILRLFALLDFICFCLLADQAYAQIISFFKNETLTAVQLFSRLLFSLGWLSIFISFILLLIPRKSGIIVYFCQLPVRFIYFMFSFGFLSLITYFTNWQSVNNLLIPIAIFGEFVRIFISYKTLQKYF
ncbi:hypothetical protein Pedsa_3048 [Pseudopedobacter saltans DSM 12145]|uniref:Uncharacterized protein n=1 Tax=Pseudopedobacter saltans (strain ATCC 51119 / DSM 12145 / JCM 21818 / CCUG 39354 / LMG 10337 / NBRC 100064 / NCIMB 13643) TaxID=762903 RepID=F0SA23_PSESL|nr:hypothetical protein Pedsa_3048 [Pseudopedobacter saltans DSM 12145]